jgi:hypothetical protein
MSICSPSLQEQVDVGANRPGGAYCDKGIAAARVTPQRRWPPHRSNRELKLIGFNPKK